MAMCLAYIFFTSSTNTALWLHVYFKLLEQKCEEDKGLVVIENELICLCTSWSIFASQFTIDE